MNRGETMRKSSLNHVLVGILFALAGASLVLVYQLSAGPEPIAASARPPESRATEAPALSPPPRPPPVEEPPSALPPPASVASPSIPQAADPAPVAASSRIEISFKLDPRLTRSLHMGDRWVSPPTYTLAAYPGTDVTIEARARALDSTGRTIKGGAPVWTPKDPGMVAVSPSERGAVRITVRRAGRSDVTVTSGAAAKRLTVAAVEERGVWRVDIAQP